MAFLLRPPLPSPHPPPGRTGGTAGARRLRRPPPRRPAGPAPLPAPARLPPHTGERLAAESVFAVAAENAAARRRVPARFLVRRRDGRAPAAARRGVLLLRHAQSGVPAAGDGAIRLPALPRLRGAVRRQLHRRDPP